MEPLGAGERALPSEIQPDWGPRSKILSGEKPVQVYRPCVPDKIAWICESEVMTIGDGVLSRSRRGERVE